MSLKISSSTINKLEHEINEIRLRTLKNIEGKLSRGLLQNENIIFNPGILLKQLIRWFGRKPLSEEETVLNLILLILRSKYVDETIKYLGLERLKCEIGKIYEILNNNHETDNDDSITNCRKLISEIIEVLENYKISLNNNNSNNSSGKNSNNNGETSNRSNNNDVINSLNIPEILTNRTISIDDDPTIIEILSDSVDAINTANDEFSSDYEKPWSLPNPSDLNSLKLLHESLSKDIEKIDELNHTFKYLYVAMLDYPAEYFLQPPYIFKALLTLYLNDKQKLTENLLRHFIHLTKSLLGRVKIRQLSKVYWIPNDDEKKILKSKMQISVTRYCTELFSICIENLKEFTEVDNQDYIFLTFQLLFKLINLIDEDPDCYITFQSLLIDLGYITKYYRQFFQYDDLPKRLWRIYYINCLHLISKIVNLNNKKMYKNSNDKSKNENDGNNAATTTVVGELYNAEQNLNKASNNRINIEVWYEELQYALLDFSIKELYPNIYENVRNALKLNSFNKTISNELEIILNCDEILLPAVKILQQPDQYENENFILKGYEAMETLSIHKSIDFVKRIFTAIIKCTPLFEGHTELKEKSENILLRLYAHENSKIKRYIYVESANTMKNFFAELMDGQQNIGKICGTKFRKTKTLGIPLTVDILHEIVCFGYTNKDICINKNADIMLTLIMRGKHILGEYWLNILDILLPNLPLLQCVTERESILGSLVFEFLSPDNDIPMIEIIQGNLRYLFSTDSSIRTEALSRLIYIILNDPDYDLYAPNILEISDTLSNDICLLHTCRDSNRIFCGGNYEKSSVYTLLELLRSTDSDPSIRKTTLMQLNIMCQDPALNELIHDENGWYLAIEAIENALKKKPIIDYADTVIPAVGIITKIALYNPRFRREISKEKNIYLLLLRSLFKYHYDTVLKQDCTLMIFLLVFSSYVIGSKNLTIPKHLSELKLPIRCDFHWHKTSYNYKSKLENIFLQLTNQNDDNDENSSTKTTTLSFGSSLRTHHQPEINNIDIQQKPELQYIRLNFTKLWFDGFEFLLKSLKNKKFNSKDQLLVNIDNYDNENYHKNCNNNKNDDNINNNNNLNYSMVPGHLCNKNNDDIVEIPDTIEFNSMLKLTSLDIKMIKYTVQSENINHFLKMIWNATFNTDVLMNLTSIKLVLLLPLSSSALSTTLSSSTSSSSMRYFKIQNLINCLRKFTMQAPNRNSEMDIQIYNSIIEFIIYFISNSNQLNYVQFDCNVIILKWLLDDLRQKHSILLQILKNFSYPRYLYQNVCKLLEYIVKLSVYYMINNNNDVKDLILYTEKISTSFPSSLSSKAITTGTATVNMKKSKMKASLSATTNTKTSTVTKTDDGRSIQQNVLNKIFEFLIPLLDESFNKRLITRFRTLLNLIQTMSRTDLIDIDYGYCLIIIKKIFNFIMILKSFTQIGSNYVKNSLLIIGNLMKNINELTLENQYIRFLSGLCSHLNYEIRGLAWCILTKLSNCLKGAQDIIKELSFLPGGFHACCLCTFLDKTEIPMVRCVAGSCFSNLLSYKNKRSSLSRPTKKIANNKNKNSDDSNSNGKDDDNDRNQIDDDGLDMTVAPLCFEIDDENTNGFELIQKIFKKYRIYTAIYRSLENFYISDVIMNTEIPEVTTCGIVVSYCSILINYIDLKPKTVINEIIEEPFLMKLINLIKRIPFWITKSTLEMANSICDLLIRVIAIKKELLERHIAHDRELIASLIDLLNLEHFEHQNEMLTLVSVMEIISIIGNETIGFEIICEIYSNKQSSEKIVQLLSHGILLEDNLEFQNACLKFIISLLIKSQLETYKFKTFADILDATQVANINMQFDNYENFLNNNHYGSEILFNNVKAIYENNFNVTSNKYGKRLKSENKKLVTEMIGVLLKTTDKSRKLANKTKFLEMIIQQLDKVLNDVGMQCTDFIRKYGDSKKIIIINDLINLYEVILNWYCSDCLMDDKLIDNLCKIIIQTWSWTSHSNELKSIVLNCLAFLSEDSISVCKKFSSMISNYTNSILQLVANYAVTETKKTKHPSIDYAQLEISLRIIINCCSCVEGRLQIVKMNLLDIFNLFHPSTTKLQKSWNTITLMWLKFWSIFSRNQEGGIVRHLILLCNLIIRANSLIGYESLTIIRNMSFINGNRAALLSSRDFLYVVKYILKNGTIDEQLLVTVTIWKLAADNYKAKHTIKNTSIPYQLKMISDNKMKFSSSSSSPKKSNNIKNCIDKMNRLTINDEHNENIDENDLVNVVEILLNILK